MAVRALDDVIAMHTLRFHDEVVDPDELEIDRGRAQARPSARSTWRPSWSTRSRRISSRRSYQDSYREAVLDLIKRKSAGKEIDLVAQEEPEQGDDLAAALQASLGNRRR